MLKIDKYTQRRKALQKRLHLNIPTRSVWPRERRGAAICACHALHRCAAVRPTPRSSLRRHRAPHTGAPARTARHCRLPRRQRCSLRRCEVASAAVSLRIRRCRRAHRLRAHRPHRCPRQPPCSCRVAAPGRGTRRSRRSRPPPRQHSRPRRPRRPPPSWPPPRSTASAASAASLRRLRRLRRGRLACGGARPLRRECVEESEHTGTHLDLTYCCDGECLEPRLPPSLPPLPAWSSLVGFGRQGPSHHPARLHALAQLC